MQNAAIRFFADDRAVWHVGTVLVAHTLPRAEWTHNALLAACVWMVQELPDGIFAERDLPGTIARFNVSVGGVNDDSQGYHETITQLYIAAVRVHLSRAHKDCALFEAVNGLLASTFGTRDWPLRLYSKDRLFSVEARRKFIEPDLLPLSELANLA